MRSARDSTSPPAKAFDSLQFQKSWRLYQARILDRLDEYLRDRHVHLVAAPGSGKTILGIEIIRRIGEPTLVLAPTITIRDQWVDRLTGSFLAGVGRVPHWVSLDLRHPAQLTITTYQALHSLCAPSSDQSDFPSAEEDAEVEATGIQNSNGDNGNHTSRRFPDVLALAGFRTLVVDEAHHLRSEWWKTLTFVAEHLEQPTVVALTATPPYDVSPFEWQRYKELCGPVDAEVSVPELVREGDLCPHQDYVYLSVPRPDDLKVIGDFRQSVQSFVERLGADGDFVQAVATHPWMIAPGDHVAVLLDDPEYVSSMVVFLNAAGAKVPHEVLNALGLPGKKIPRLDLEWVEILLTRCLYPMRRASRLVSRC